jgi:TctA family transporter
MDLLSGILLGFENILNPTLILYCFIGVFLGTFIGVLPGIGPLAAITLLFPITYHLDPILSIVMLAGIYYGAEYGGSISSILLNMPGTVSNAVTCIDGFQMSKNGKAGVALFITTISSFIGGLFGIFSLILLAPYIAKIGLMFGPAEYFSLMILGLVAASMLAIKSAIKGFSMVLFGLLLSTIGTDLFSGIPRFYFEQTELMDGIGLVVLAIGFFGLVELINSSSTNDSIRNYSSITLRSMIPSKDEFRKSILPSLRGSFIGTFFGALPGTGSAIASFVSYSTEKKINKNPSQFGNGAIEGVSAPEAANNAAAQGSFIPTLTLGIPGSATMAIILGALMIHGIQPGPKFIFEHSLMFWTLIASFFLGNIILVFLNIPLIGIWVSILKIRKKVLYPIILSLMMIGVYSVNKNVFDIYLLIIFGAVGYFLSKCDYEFSPLLLGFVLGPLMEENLRRALIISKGDFTIFVNRPISLTIILICLCLVIAVCFRQFQKKPH